MPKNIVVCYDGTGNEYGKHNTNVVGAYRSVVHDEEQVAFYDPGVGTFSVLGRRWGKKKVGILLGKAFGYGLVDNVEDGYEYLMNTYERGDQVFILGFSRGAFTARALAGMLNKVGLLHKGSVNLISYASEFNFRKDADENVLEGFKRTYSRECKPRFVGVWDTVASFGYFRGKQFKDNVLNHDVEIGCQAVSIDERRKKFPISLWDESNVPEGQRIEQVWFAGVHSDVGGWYVERGLSDTAMRWMMNKAESAGLKLKPEWEAELAPDPLGKRHKSRTGGWRVWRPVQRMIPEGSKIHDSVRVRMEELGDEPALPNSYEFV